MFQHFTFHARNREQSRGGGKGGGRWVTKEVRSEEIGFSGTVRKNNFTAQQSCRRRAVGKTGCFCTRSDFIQGTLCINRPQETKTAQGPALKIRPCALASQEGRGGRRRRALGDEGSAERRRRERAAAERGPGACPPPDEGRGRGPLDTSSCAAGTKETMGGAGGSEMRGPRKSQDLWGARCDRSPPGPFSLTAAAGLWAKRGGFAHEGVSDRAVAGPPSQGRRSRVIAGKGAGS